MDRTLIRAGIAAALAVGAAGIGAAANPSAAAPTAATVTAGDFQPFAVGAGLDIGGQAHMVRTADGRTLVNIVVTGLEPGVTYPSHVHAAPCGTGDADGHYMHDPSGPVTPPNEIWPGPITANAAGIARGHTVADFPAGVTAVSVVVHRPGATPNKIACADLG
jgi:hypothetical protein